MKKTRKMVPLTQREVKNLLNRPQAQVGFEIAVTSEIDPSEDQKHGTGRRDFNAKSPSVPKENGMKR